MQDGTYDVGPLPGLGGPFITATEYFEAWAKSAKFVETMDRVKQIWGEGYEEIIAQIASFPPRVGEVASKISARDQGPFPLFHVDFGHNNIVVDDDYNVLGVIDWEHACSVPWERIGGPQHENHSRRAEKVHQNSAGDGTKQRDIALVVRYPSRSGKPGPGLRNEALHRRRHMRAVYQRLRCPPRKMGWGERTQRQ